MMKTARTYLLTLTSVGLLAACSGSNGPAPSSSTEPNDSNNNNGGGGMVRCTSPTPAEAVDMSVTVNVPSDFDPSASPSPTPTTVVDFTVLYPERCPEDRFPVVLQSHGFGGERQRELGSADNLQADDAHFPSMNTLAIGLPFHDYVVISFDERGHGTPLPGQAAHNARLIDSNAEVQDARAILDWAFNNAATNHIETQPDSGIDRDIRVASFGYSYGGGFQLPLGALDPRIDAMIPQGTWNNLLYSLGPGDAVKLGYAGALTALALQGNVNASPLLATAFNTAGLQAVGASSIRTREDLVNAMTAPNAQPRPAVDEDEVIDLFFTRGLRFFETQQMAGQPWGFGEDQAVLRPIPTLLLQGNRDVLFNLTDAYFNYQYLDQAGSDVRLLTTEGGHALPTVNQIEGTANCGGIVGVDAVAAWLDRQLKDIESATFDAIPRVCISVTPTPDAGTAPTNDQLTAVTLDSIPVGSLVGEGAVPARADTLSIEVQGGSQSTPSFVPVRRISAAEAGAVLAGIPRMDSLTVTPSAGSLVTAVAYAGIGIRRNGEIIVVDDQVTGFANTQARPEDGTNLAHINNRGTQNNEVLLPGVGELLEVDDEIGLVFFENHPQFLAFNNQAQNGPFNPYSVDMINVGIPILIPGAFANSALSTP